MLAFVRGMPMFAMLPVPAIERIANNLEQMQLPAGEILIREGDVGDRLYIIVEGDAVVTRDGVHVADQTVGDHVGEIALLRDVPRTASVTAKTAMKLLTLEREPFLEAVTGHPQSRERAEAIVQERLPDRSGDP
jgi:CRP-like cAMP-binding protein